MTGVWVIAWLYALFTLVGAWYVWWPDMRRGVGRVFATGRLRRRLPAVMRHGTPREGGRGTLNPEDYLYACGGHLERTAASGSGLVAANTQQAAWQALVARNTARLDATRAASPDSRPELVTPLEWRATQAQQRHETLEERTRRAMAERAWRGPW
jgi:hypothetical protein